MTGITFGGMSSGLDTSAIIEALMSRERLPLTRLQQKVSTYQNSTKALTDINSKLSALSTAAEKLNDSTFDLKRVAISNDSILSATVGSNASDGEYTIDVEQLATRNSFGTTNNDITDIDTLTVGSGTFTISQGGTDYIIDTSGEQYTLDKLRDEINVLDEGFTASIINLSADSENPQYALTITSKETGTDNALTIDNQLIGGDRDLTFNENVVDKDARIVINGITVERSSNTIDDVIDNVTLNLKQEDLTETVNMKITTDLSGIKKDIKAFIDTYNDLKSQLDSYTGENGVLEGDSAVRNLESSLRSSVTRSFPGIRDVNDTYTTLGQIGIEYGRDGVLTFNESDFDDAFEDNPEEIQNLFETGFKANSTDIDLIYKPLNVSGGTYTVNVTSLDDGSGNIVGTITYDGVEYTAVGSSTSLKGPEDSPIEGLIFSVDAVGSYEVNISQGLGNLMESVIDQYTDFSDGVLTLKKDRMESSIETMNKEIEQLEIRLSRKEEFYLQKFARMEEALSQLQAIQSSFSAF